MTDDRRQTTDGRQAGKQTNVERSTSNAERPMMETEHRTPNT